MNILILEDDAKFLKPINNLPHLPKNWQMLYLGGTVHKNFGESDAKGWWKVQCWTTHAYIINLQNKDFLALKF